MPDGTATAHLYRPKLASVLREGYGLGDFRKDAMAALTVAIVALPLSMAIAVASGVSPERGIYTSIVGGFIVSALGGSRFQIGGPAGAFIVLVASTVASFGLDGLFLTVQTEARDGRGHQDNEGAGRPTDLKPAAAERRDDETAHYRRVDAALGRDAGRHGDRHRQGERYDSD